MLILLLLLLCGGKVWRFDIFPENFSWLPVLYHLFEALLIITLTEKPLQ